MRRDWTGSWVCRRGCSGQFSARGSWEIHAAHRGLALWQALIDGGATPYGTEAMHVLRAEKGFIIVGQETDGTVTPFDVGMGWAVSKRKDFIGKRSYNRPDTARPDRKHLVGLLPLDRKVVLPEGGQIVADPAQGAAGDHARALTSTSLAELDGGFALALLKNSRTAGRHRSYSASDGGADSGAGRSSRCLRQEWKAVEC